MSSPLPVIPQVGPGAEIELDNSPDGRRMVIGSQLGQGCFGAVYRATIKGDSTPYAIKVLVERTEKQTKHYDRETEHLGVLSNPNSQVHNIIKFFFQFRLHLPDFAVRCVVTELLGPSLYDIVSKKRSSLPFSHVVTIGRQLLDAVAYMHSVALVHTDIKASNVLTVPGQFFSIKLADMGNTLTIRKLQRQTGLNSVQPVAYRAPEVYLGMPIAPSIDVWSVGCLLAEMYTGYLLFPAHDCHSVARFHYELVGLPDCSIEAPDFEEYYTFTYDDTSILPVPWTSEQLRQMNKEPVLDLRDMKLKCIRDLLRYRNTTEPVQAREGLLMDLVQLLLNPTAIARPSAFQALFHGVFRTRFTGG